MNFKNMFGGGYRAKLLARKGLFPPLSPMPLERLVPLKLQRGFVPHGYAAGAGQFTRAIKGSAWAGGLCAQTLRQPASGRAHPSSC